jgi:hypothetical protein
MAVSIGEISSEFVVDQPASGASGGSSAPSPAPEVQIEELRAIIRELLVEELERYLRLAVER